MKPLKLDTDSFGRILGAGIHDSVLSEFYLSSKGKLTLHLSRGGKPRSVVCFSTVSDICIKYLRSAAILSDMYAWPLARVPDVIWDIPDGAWATLWGGFLATEDAEKRADQLKREHPELYLVHVESSFGASLALICKRIEIKIDPSN